MLLCADTDQMMTGHGMVRLSIASAPQGELEALTGSALGDAEALMALAAGNQAEDEALEAEEVRTCCATTSFSLACSLRSSAEVSGS